MRSAAMHQRIKETIVKRLLVWLAAACLLPLSAAAQNVTYIHTDALGSPVLETNAQAQVVRQVDYRAYGMEVMDARAPAPATPATTAMWGRGWCTCNSAITIRGLGSSYRWIR